MALPKMSSTIYNTTIPSTGVKIQFRPFNVRDQKSLLLAQQSEDHTIMIDTMKSVIGSCIVQDININKLAIFDLEFLFLQIRAKSVGEIVELLFKCDKCAEEAKVSFDLTKLNVIIPENHNKKIELGSGMGLIMKYPTIEIVKLMENFDATDVETVFKIMLSCIDQIYDPENVYHSEEHTQEELEEFIGSLDTNQFKLIQTFFDTMPHLEQKVVYDCPKCKHHHEKVMRGIDNFF